MTRIRDEPPARAVPRDPPPRSAGLLGPSIRSAVGVLRPDDDGPLLAPEMSLRAWVTLGAVAIAAIAGVLLGLNLL